MCGTTIHPPPGHGTRSNGSGGTAYPRPAQSIVDYRIREAICVPVQGLHTTLGVLYADLQSDGLALAASGNFGQVVRRNYPVAIASRFGAEPAGDVTVVGCLCTPLDRLADDVALPEARPGDLVAVFLAGAYGLSASPQAFLAQQAAREMVVGAAF